MAKRLGAYKHKRWAVGSEHGKSLTVRIFAHGSGPTAAINAALRKLAAIKR